MGLISTVRPGARRQPCRTLPEMGRTRCNNEVYILEKVKTFIALFISLIQKDHITKPYCPSMDGREFCTLQPARF